NVVDGYIDVVCEGLEQGDLAVDAEMCQGAADADLTDGNAFSHQGDAEDRAMAHAPRGLTTLGKFLHFGLYVGDVDGPPVQHGSTNDGSGDQRERELADRPGGDRAVVCDQQHAIAVPEKDGGVE